jgi:hypothetical protein
MNSLEVGMGISEKNDSRAAGEEVVLQSLNNLSTKPSFFLLFSTIHYDKNGGLDTLLQTVSKKLPQETPLIGGTIAGFITHRDCFVKGVLGIAVYYKNMDVAIGIGQSTKRKPKKAAQNCARMLKKGLNASEYQNKFLLNFVSAPSIPSLPGIGKVNIIKNRLFGSFASYLLLPFFSYFGKGFGKEEDIIAHLNRSMPDFDMIGGSTIDDVRYLGNYQFYGNKVYTNSIVAIACASDLPLSLDGSVKLNPATKPFAISKSPLDGHVLTKIDNHPAKKELLKLLDIDERQIRNLSGFYYKLSHYFPIEFDSCSDYVSGVGGLFGNNVILGYKAKGDKAKLLSASGKAILNNVADNLKSQAKDSSFLLGFSSAICLNILGRDAFRLKDLIDEQLPETPYAILYTINENLGKANEIATTRVYSFSTLSVGGANKNDN